MRKAIRVGFWAPNGTAFAENIGVDEVTEIREINNGFVIERPQGQTKVIGMAYVITYEEVPE